MKTKIILALAICAITTISFSFTSSNIEKGGLTQEPSSELKSSEPIGGFVSEDKF